MLVDTGKLGSMREIEQTDMRSVLLFLVEYPAFKGEQPPNERRVFGDQTDFA
jgi:hypothetical protein